MNNKKPVMIYFRSPNDNDVTKGDSTVVQDYNDVLPVHIVTCDGWAELDRLLLDHPDQIAINCNVFTSTDVVTIEETVAMLTTKLKLARVDAPITLVIENDTLRHVVLQAKRLGLQGLIPYHGDWDPADIMAGLTAMSNRISHWPEHIINQLPEVEQKPIGIIFRKNAKDYITSIETTYAEEIKRLPYISKLCDSWDELSDMIKLKPCQILIHTSMINSNGATVHEFVSMIETLIKVSANIKIPLAIAIEKDTPLSVVKEFQKNNFLGIVPGADSFGFTETVKGLEALFNRIPYWPKHILEQLPGAKKIIVKNTISVTPRQSQIVDLILERGLSNKKIAQALNITESTVKIHVSAILKAYGVRTRTQLVVSSHK